jgi:vancomycin resistance protein YoaR
MDRPEGLKIAAGLGLALLVGGLLGLSTIPRAGGGAQSAQSVMLYGRALPRDQELDAALGWIDERLAGRFALELPDGATRLVGYGALGIELERARLKQLLVDAADATSPLSRYRAETEAGGPFELIVPIRLDPARAVPTLVALKQELDRPARDAHIDLTLDQVIAEQDGLLLDVDATLGRITRAVEQGSERAAPVFVRTPAKRRLTELQGIRHDQLLGFFETNYDRAERAAARTFNLRLAASKLDGHVLFPGEELDFNAVVGPRDEAHGYQIAPVIAQGELVDGIGGGTCQISGTLHAAALFAGLTIVERYPHTRPSAYIKLGLDAAVVYPSMTLRVKNPYEFPVVLHQTVEDGVVRAEFRGARRPNTVTMIRRIDDALPFEETERFDEALAKGKRVIEQRGVPGLKLHRYRILRAGDHALRERVSDVYPPTTQIVRVGIGNEAPNDSLVEPRAITHPEYVADELLVMTHQPDESPPFVVSQTPGRFGRAGWTEEWKQASERPK